MLHKLLYNHIKGYVNIQIEGYFIEKFINLCTAKKIFLWNIKKEPNNVVYTNISIQDFKKISKIAKQTKCRVKIQNKKGIPFLLHRYHKRKIFIFFLAFILLGIWLLSNFVWNIQIEGNVSITTEELQALVEQEGLKIGKWKGQIETKQIINQMRLKRDDLAWVGIEIKGTNAIVKVVEADQKPEIINEEEYCNIIAEKDGVIVKVNALNGTSLVKEGDVVKQGMVLIGGFLEGKYTGTRYVHANGEVQAKVWYTTKKQISLNEKKKTYTGKEQKFYAIKINNFQINLGKPLSKFQKYDTIVQNEKIKLFSNFYIPIDVIKTTNQEFNEEEIKYTIEEAKQKAVEEAKKELDEQTKGKEIVNTYVTYKENGNQVEAEVTYEVLEEIGTKEKIVF